MQARYGILWQFDKMFHSKQLAGKSDIEQYSANQLHRPETHALPPFNVIFTYDFRL